jgi:Sulfotransferase domain
MKVIGAGFGRTGTMSLKVALEQLGFGPCYHMIEVFSHVDDVPAWERAARGEKVDWKSLLAGWESAVDWPPCTFYEQLMEVYPEAKVILTPRDPEKWYESTTNTIWQAKLQAHRTPRDPNARVVPMMRAMGMINQLIWEGTFHDRFQDKAYAIEIFEKNTADVKKKVPAERLLVYEIQEGWEPLATFLGVPVPADKPFPRVNDTASFLDMIKRTQPGAAPSPIIP